MSKGIGSSIFRIFRVTVVVLVLIGTATWIRRSMTSVESEQAVINAEILQIRTPITGILEMKEIRPGMALKQGTPLFRVENPRFGDRESVTQYNALQTLSESLRSELMGAEQTLLAAKVALSRNRDLYKDKLIARREVEIDEMNVSSGEKLVAAKKEQLARSEARTREMANQMDLQKQCTGTMPIDGVVWSISGKTGEQLDSNTKVLEILNPSRVWVDAFFAERFAGELRPGLEAQIHSLDGTMTWKGTLGSVRAGVGRLAYDTTVAVPPPETAKRQIAVRVEATGSERFEAIEFFGVGRSVLVTFNKPKPPRTVGDVLQERLSAMMGSGQAMTKNAAK